MKSNERRTLLTIYYVIQLYDRGSHKESHDGLGIPARMTLILIKLNNSIKKLEPDKNLNPFTIENGNSIKANKMPKQKRSVGLFGM
jgi:hypothetical protein